MSAWDELGNQNAKTASFPAVCDPHILLPPKTTGLVASPPDEEEQRGPGLSVPRNAGVPPRRPRAVDRPEPSPRYRSLRTAARGSAVAAEA